MKPFTKTNLCLATTALLVLGSGQNALAQPFNSGSDGSYGAMNIISNTTLQLPPNGIFNCTTITVASGATLTFNRNALNTPVWLLATGDVNVDGAIDVSGGNPVGRTPGLGGPGGFDGGEGGYGGTAFGGTGQGADGKGPGGGRLHGNGSYASSYGNSLIIPLIGGSGGAGADGNPGVGGGGAGGAILIASSTRITIVGGISARSGFGNSEPFYVYYVGWFTNYYRTGSGGAIRVVAPIVTGNGGLDAVGFGNAGRIRIDCLDGQAVRSLTPSGLASRGSQMFVFPAVQPRLDVIEAAGQTIPAPASSGVTVVLPVDAPATNQIVKVQARDFTNDVAITVAVIPNDRSSYTYQATIVMTNNPSVLSVPVTLAVDSTNRIMVWTR